MSNPAVSVLMTSYNREKYIAGAVNSVLASSFANFELIVCDDKSTDNTTSIVKKMARTDKRVKLFEHEKNVGDYANRNRAASYAQGTYIKYLDSDDIMYPHCLQVMVHSMLAFPDAGFGLSCRKDSKQPYPVCLQPHDAYMEHYTGMGHFDRAPGSSIILRSAFEKTGGFSGKRMIGDYEFWLKIGRLYSMVKFPVDLYWSRLHNESESSSDYAKQYAKLKAELDNEALSNKDLPLSKEEIKQIAALKVKGKIKTKVRQFLKG